MIEQNDNAVPIIADGDVIGSVVCASSDGEATIDGDVEFRLSRLPPHFSRVSYNNLTFKRQLSSPAI